MSEEPSLRRGENRIYRLIDRGPIFMGLPIIQAAIIAGLTAVGYWPVKFLFGQRLGLLWVFSGGALWAFVGFINNQDKTYLPHFFLKLSGVVMKESITSFVASDQKIEVR